MSVVCRHCGGYAEPHTNEELGMPLCSECADMAVLSGTCTQCGDSVATKGCDSELNREGRALATGGLA